MSEPLDDRTLDTLIDESARSLTAAEAAPGLRARVFSRIHQDADGGRKPRWLVPGIAIASACVAAIAIFVGSGFSRSDDVSDVTGVGSGLSRSNESQTSSSLLKPDPTAETSSIRLKPDPTSSNVGSGSNAGSDFSRSSDSALIQSEPPPGFEPIGAAQLTIDPLGVPALTPPDAMSVESIPLESIEVGALGTE